MRARGVAVLAGVAVVVTALVVVALVFLLMDDPAPVAAPSLPASPPATESTPTPTPVIEPTIPFEGDCRRVLTPTQLDGLLGEGWTSQQEQWAGAGDTASLHLSDTSLGTLGGLECAWYSADAGVSGILSLSVVLLPADQVPAAFASAYSEARCDPSYDALGCRLGRTFGDLWVMPGVYIISGEDPPEMLGRAADEVAATVGETFDGVAADRRAEWFELPACDALAEEMRLQEVLGTGYVNGYWEGVEQPEQTMLTQAGVGLHCPWVSIDGSAPGGKHFIGGATLASGGAWAWDAIASVDSAGSATVDGAVAAVTVDVGNANRWLYATDGVNLITVENAETADLIEIAERLLATLKG